MKNEYQRWIQKFQCKAKPYVNVKLYDLERFSYFRARIGGGETLPSPLNLPLNMLKITI
jgi:hypothetical protein